MLLDPEDHAAPSGPASPTGGRIPPLARGALPVLGHLHHLRRDKLGFMKRAADEGGDVVMLRFGAGWPVALVSNPLLIEKILLDPPRTLRKSRFFWRHVDALFGNGIIMSHGDAWARQRRMMTPAFSARRVASYVPALVGAARTMLSGWEGDAVRDVHQEMIDLSLAMVLKTLFDIDDPAVVRRIGVANYEITGEISRRSTRPFVIPDAVPLPGHLRYRRGIAAVERYVADTIADRRANPGDRGDLFSQMMAELDEDGKPLSDVLLRDEAFSLLAAGHETTALGLCWGLHLLGRHPEIQEALREEVLSVLGPDRDPTPDDLRSLKLTENVVLETLRLYPPVWFLGRANPIGADVRVDDWLLPAGTSIYMVPWIVHRDPKWFPDPEAFRPDRWRDGFARSLPKCAYMPFSYGPRTCVGRSFAMAELVSVLALLCRDWRFESLGGEARLDPSIGLRPKDPLRMRTTRRG